MTAPPHVVTDIELHFRGTGLVVAFTFDEQRGDTVEHTKGGERRYVLRLSEAEETHIAKWEDVQYERRTLRAGEDETPPRRLGGGVTVLGEMPDLG